MKNGKPLSPAIVESITQLTASGRTQQEIAAMLDVSRTSVQRYGADPEIRAKIEGIQAGMAGELLDQIIEMDQAIIDTAQEFIQGQMAENGKRVKKARPKEYENAPVLMSLYHKLSKGIRRSLGIEPGPGQNIFIENLYANKGRVIAPGVLALISGAFIASTDNENEEAIIEGEYSIIE